MKSLIFIMCIAALAALVFGGAMDRPQDDE